MDDAAPRDRPDEGIGLDLQTGLLEQLTHRGVAFALSGVDAATRGRPPRRGRGEALVGILVEEHVAGVIEHEQPDGRAAPHRAFCGACGHLEARTALTAGQRHAGLAGEVGLVPRPLETAPIEQRLGQGFALGVGVLHDEQTAGLQQVRGAFGDLERKAKAVLATAVQRNLRVVLGNLGVDRHHAGGHVRRVAHDDVETALELR